MTLLGIPLLEVIARLEHIMCLIGVPQRARFKLLRSSTLPQGSGEHEGAAGGQGEEDGGELHFGCGFGELE